MQAVEGIVLDVGWYRTTIRSFEREIYNIPNSVFSRNVVLNITRKQREWRFFEFIGAHTAQLRTAPAAPIPSCSSDCKWTCEVLSLTGHCCEPRFARGGCGESAGSGGGLPEGHPAGPAHHPEAAPPRFR